jgi:hypothetical protein
VIQSPDVALKGWGVLTVAQYIQARVRARPYATCTTKSLSACIEMDINHLGPERGHQIESHVLSHELPLHRSSFLSTLRDDANCGCFLQRTSFLLS